MPFCNGADTVDVQAAECALGELIGKAYIFHATGIQRRGNETGDCGNLIGDGVSGPALAQDYPNKPIKFFVGFPPGGPSRF